MKSQRMQNILLLGNDENISYLLGRFAEQSEYQLTIAQEKIASHDLAVAKPLVVIFSSMDILDKCQTLVTELTRLEVPIIVCSSVTDQTRARELGADSCLLHPITFDGFQNALTIVNTMKYS